MSGLSWMNKSPEIVEEYQSFIVDLLVAHNKYTNIIVSRLISHFLPTESESWTRGTPTDDVRLRLMPIHNLIHKLLDVIPMMFQILLQQISQWFPYYKKSSYIFSGFVYNLFWLIDYRPIYKEDILHLIVLKLLELDVSISRHEIEDAEDSEENEENELQDAVVCQTENDVKEFGEDEMRHPLAETLDFGLHQLFAYIEKEISVIKGNEAKMSQFFEIFLRIFETDILPTHNSHHVQFILFYLCHFEVSFQ